MTRRTLFVILVGALAIAVAGAQVGASLWVVGAAVFFWVLAVHLAAAGWRAWVERRRQEQTLIRLAELLRADRDAALEALALDVAMLRGERGEEG